MSPLMVVEQAHSDLDRECWRFVYIGSEHSLRLVEWSHETRPTKRHKFRPLEAWSTYRRDGTQQPKAIPEAVERAALQQFTRPLTVTRSMNR